MAVYASISISLDGFYVGQNPTPQQPMGKSGAALHRWFRHDVADRNQLTANDILQQDFNRLGAMIMGRESYEHAQAAWGPRPPFESPIYVLTHRPRPNDVREGTTFHFVTDGFDAALERAQTVVQDRDVVLHGGGAIRQGLNHRMLDEFQTHLVPVLLGSGRKLFDELDVHGIHLELDRVVEGTGVTHIRYRTS